MLRIINDDYDINVSEPVEGEEATTANTRKYIALSPFALDPDHPLGDITALAQEANRLATFITQVETTLTKLKKEYDTLTSYILPNVMATNHVATYTLEDGTTVTSKTTVSASLPKEDLFARDRALKWINKQGGGSLIKDQLVVESPTQDLIDTVKGKFPMERKQDVHPSALKAFMSDLLGYKKGSVARITEEEVPPELHVFVKNTVVVK